MRMRTITLATYQQCQNLNCEFIMSARNSSRNSFLPPRNKCPHERLFHHETMSFTRRRANYRPNNEPLDELDFVMEAMYDPLENTFPHKGDPYLHMETVYDQRDPRYKSWRVLRNYKVVEPPKVLERGHPIVYGGVKEKESLFHVKLGIPSDHSPQTNPGYSRTPSGAFYAI